MRVIPITLKQANDFVLRHHRHHGKAQGCKFCIGVIDNNGALRGVAITGRPVSRYLDNGVTAEITRLCTDGYPNACSFLYAACYRIAKEMGYRKIITYILDTESGASLKGAGWIEQGLCGGGNWNVKSRPRQNSPNSGKKKLFYKIICEKGGYYDAH